MGKEREPEEYRRTDRGIQTRRSRSKTTRKGGKEKRGRQIQEDRITREVYG